MAAGLLGDGWQRDGDSGLRPEKSWSWVEAPVASRVGLAARCESVIALVNCRCLVKRRAIRVGVRPQRPGRFTGEGSGCPSEWKVRPEQRDAAGPR